MGPEQRGTCFRAAGFHYVGRTTGRGRHAETKACTRTKKAVFVYDLDRRWRKHLGVAHVDAYPKLEAGAGLDAETWAAQEFGDAQLGDKRRTSRLVNSVTILARAPGESITATMKSDRAAIRGYYRFIEKANERGTTPADILAPHRRRTIERMRTEKTVLCLQDGTDINYSTRPACEGLEVIGRNQTTAKARGVHLHTTLALSAEGLPLGVLRCAYRTQAGKHAAKTQQWIDGLHDLAEAATHLSSKTRVLCVMDREADIFALFAAQQQVGRVDLLVRAKANRRLGRKGPLLFEFMRQGAPKGTIEVAIQRLSRREKSGRVKHKGRAGRIAQMEVRYRTVMLPPTRGQQGGPVKVTAIHVGEAGPARRTESDSVVPAYDKGGDLGGTGRNNGRLLHVTLACGRRLPDSQECVQGAGVALAEGRQSSPGHHHQHGDGVAPALDDVTGSTGPGSTSRDPVYRRQLKSEVQYLQTSQYAR